MATLDQQHPPFSSGFHGKPRVVIIGAGMSGISAAHHLVSCSASSYAHSQPETPLEILVLEGSSRMGGRICTTSLGGARIELGATWIHGVEGSPVYEIANRIGSIYPSQSNPSMVSGSVTSPLPYERQDGFPIFSSTIAEGGLLVDESWIEPSIRAFNSTIDEVKGKHVENLISGDDNHISKKWVSLEGSIGPPSVGSFVRKFGLQALMEYETGAWAVDEKKELGFGWDMGSLRAAVFHMQEDLERLGTASNSLFDVDLAAEREYREFPGDHITIGGGYMSVLEEMARALPSGTIQFEKMVTKVVWNRTNGHGARPALVVCMDGSAIEADHVIITVSLGVLKSCTSASPGNPFPDSLPGAVLRSVDELQGLLPNPDHSHQFFDPALPPWKLASISRLGFGVVNKLFLEVDPCALLLFDRIFGSFIKLIPRRAGSGPGVSKTSIESNIPPWMGKTFSLCPIYKGSNVLLCWFAGAEALEMEELSDEEIIDGVVATLTSYGLHKGPNEEAANAKDEEAEESALKQRLKRSFVRVLRSKWGTNPLCKGSYSFVATGASGGDIEALAKPLPSPKPPTSSFFLPPVSASSEASAVSTISSGALPPAISRSSSASMISSLSITSSTLSSSESTSSSDHEEESEDEYVLVEPVMGTGGGKPLQLLFAGEATHRHYYSTTHGAFLSGAREADRLLQFYHLKK